MFYDTDDYIGDGNSFRDMNQDIIDFARQLDRRLFIDDEYQEYAHCDHPLPIGYGQTISQPSLVLEMTLQLQLIPGCKVLEIGTGSGYQTAFLAHFAGQVYTIERIKELSEKAQKRLTRMGYSNIHFRIGDGSQGWEKFAPYDRIIAAASAGQIPDELVAQLKPGGRMILPVGQPEEPQDLLLVYKNEADRISTEILEKVHFVEFKGKYGWQQSTDP